MTQYNITLGLQGAYQPTKSTTAKDKGQARGILKEWRERTLEEEAMKPENREKNEVTEIKEDGDTLYFDIIRGEKQISMRAEAAPQ